MRGLDLKQILLTEAIRQELSKPASSAQPETDQWISNVLAGIFPIAPSAAHGVPCPSGKTTTVYEFDMPKKHVGFITEVANVYIVEQDRQTGTVTSSDDLYLAIDGILYETPSLKREIASINNPLQIQPWYRLPVHNKIIWTVRNGGTQTHNYDVVVKGFYIFMDKLSDFFRLHGLTVP